MRRVDPGRLATRIVGDPTPLSAREKRHAFLETTKNADFWATFRWPKAKRETDPRSEFIETQIVLNTLAANFKQVVPLGRNHTTTVPASSWPTGCRPTGWICLQLTAHG